MFPRRTRRCIIDGTKIDKTDDTYHNIEQTLVHLSE